MAGQMIMQGFIRRQIPVWLRRAITMLPAFVVVARGVNTTEALVMSQVVLSIALPVPMVALILFARRRDVMGEFAVQGPVLWLAGLGAGLVLALNFVLLWQMAGFAVPGLSS